MPNTGTLIFLQREDGSAQIFMNHPSPTTRLKQTFLEAQNNKRIVSPTKFGQFIGVSSLRNLMMFVYKEYTDVLYIQNRSQLNSKMHKVVSANTI